MAPVKRDNIVHHRQHAAEHRKKHARDEHMNHRVVRRRKPSRVARQARNYAREEEYGHRVARRRHASREAGHMGNQDKLVYRVVRKRKPSRVARQARNYAREDEYDHRVVRRRHASSEARHARNHGKDEQLYHRVVRKGKPRRVAGHAGNYVREEQLDHRVLRRRSPSRRRSHVVIRRGRLRRRSNRSNNIPHGQYIGMKNLERYAREQVEEIDNREKAGEMDAREKAWKMDGREKAEEVDVKKKKKVRFQMDMQDVPEKKDKGRHQIVINKRQKIKEGASKKEIGLKRRRLSIKQNLGQHDRNYNKIKRIVSRVRQKEPVGIRRRIRRYSSGHELGRLPPRYVPRRRLSAHRKIQDFVEVQTRENQENTSEYDPVAIESLLRLRIRDPTDDGPGRERDVMAHFKGEGKLKFEIKEQDGAQGGKMARRRSGIDLGREWLDQDIQNGRKLYRPGIGGYDMHKQKEEFIRRKEYEPQRDHRRRAKGVPEKEYWEMRDLERYAREKAREDDYKKKKKARLQQVIKKLQESMERTTEKELGSEREREEEHKRRLHEEEEAMKRQQHEERRRQLHEEENKRRFQQRETEAKWNLRNAESERFRLQRQEDERLRLQVAEEDAARSKAKEDPSIDLGVPHINARQMSRMRRGKYDDDEDATSVTFYDTDNPVSQDRIGFHVTKKINDYNEMVKALAEEVEMARKPNYRKFAKKEEANFPKHRYGGIEAKKVEGVPWNYLVGEEHVDGERLYLQEKEDKRLRNLTAEDDKARYEAGTIQSSSSSRLEDSATNVPYYDSKMPVSADKIGFNVSKKIRDYDRKVLKLEAEKSGKAEMQGEDNADAKRLKSLLKEEDKQIEHLLDIKDDIRHLHEKEDERLRIENAEEIESLKRIQDGAVEELKSLKESPGEKWRLEAEDYMDAEDVAKHDRRQSGGPVTSVVTYYDMDSIDSQEDTTRARRPDGKFNEAEDYMDEEEAGAHYPRSSRRPRSGTHASSARTYFDSRTLASQDEIGHHVKKKGDDYEAMLSRKFGHSGRRKENDEDTKRSRRHDRDFDEAEGYTDSEEIRGDDQRSSRRPRSGTHAASARTYFDSRALAGQDEIGHHVKKKGDDYEAMLSRKF